MNGKDRGFFAADLGFNFALQCAKIRTGFIASGLVVGQFGGNLGVFEALRIWINENFVNHIGSAYRNSG